MNACALLSAIDTFLAMPVVQSYAAHHLPMAKYSEDQPRGDDGRWGDGGGGSATPMFASAPVSGAGATAWRQSMQEAYTTDSSFRTTADAVAMFTQGEYNSLRALSEQAITGNFPAAYQNSSIAETIDRPMSGSPLVEYNNYFQGQDLGQGSSATWGQAARALNEGIRTSAPINQPFYRGVNGRDTVAQLSQLQAGQSFDIIGPSSFTASQDIATKFSLNIASGQYGGALGRGVPSAIIEIQSGARGIPAAALSPWKQQEVISSGHFTVVSNTTVTREVWNTKGKFYHNVDQTRVVLKQDGVWRNKNS